MKVSVSFLSLPLSTYVLYSKINVANGFTFSAQPQLLGAWPLQLVFPAWATSPRAQFFPGS